MEDNVELTRPVSEDTTFSMRFITATLKKKWPNVQNISTEVFYKWSEQINDISDGASSCASVSLPKLYILDCRPLEEFNVSHIEGATRVCPDASDVTETIQTITETCEGQGEGHVNVVCYCSLGYRSSRYAETLAAHLNTDKPNLTKMIEVYNLDGSLFKWANENRPMVDCHNRTTQYAHPYSFVWGKLLNKELRKSSVDSS